MLDERMLNLHLNIGYETPCKLKATEAIARGLTKQKKKYIYWIKEKKKKQQTKSYDFISLYTTISVTVSIAAAAAAATYIFEWEKKKKNHFMYTRCRMGIRSDLVKWSNESSSHNTKLFQHLFLWIEINMYYRRFRFHFMINIWSNVKENNWIRFFFASTL